ncbi:hypothetical protein FRB99_000098 [Tulasnella sp. 403]|nr:hypothetical protein FRB99_000098 [Tulasnella sp. 403]
MASAVPIGSSTSQPPPPSSHTSPAHPQSHPPLSPQAQRPFHHPSPLQVREPTPSVASASSPQSLIDVDDVAPSAPLPVGAHSYHDPEEHRDWDNSVYGAGPWPSEEAPRDASSSSSASGHETDTDRDTALPTGNITDADPSNQPPQQNLLQPPTDHAPLSASEANPNPSKKPKSRVKRPRGQSPSPPPIPRPPPRLTIRLDFTLGGPSNYEVNIKQSAKETGQAPPTPPPPPKPSDTESSSEDEAPAPAAATAGGIVKRRRRVNTDYDLDDPFIDDSDLRIDAPTHFAQTKQQGFYVSSGDVALVKDKTPKKVKPPKSSLVPGPGRREGRSLTSLLMNATVVAEAPAKVAPLTTVHGDSKVYQPNDVSMSSGSGAPANGAGTRDSPIALLDDEEKPILSSISFDGNGPPAAKRIKLDDGTPQPSRSRPPPPLDMKPVSQPMAQADSHISISPSTAMFTGASDTQSTVGRKRKISKEGLEKIFHPDVTQALRELKTTIDEANWETKGKFPPHLKPLLQSTAIVALKHGDYNDNFFDYLPTIFPYNRFTMMKLTSRLMYQEHQKFLQDRQNALLDELKQIAVEDFAKAQEDFAKACAAWEERQKRRQLLTVEGGTPGEGASNAMDVDSRPHSPNPAVHNDSEAAGNPGKEKLPGQREREDKAPIQKYKWTDAIKSRVWGLVHLSNESARLTSLMHGWDATIPIATEQSLRKNLYARITAVFPEGWMNSQIISREVSNMKLKLKKESEQGAKADE